MKGYMDRIEDSGKAVIILEEQRSEIVLPVRDLPEGSRAGSWFQIYEENGGFSFELDEDERKRREQRAMEMTRRLQGRSRDSKFKRK